MGVIRGLTIETTRTPNPGVTRRRLGYAIVASAVFAGCSVDRARLPLGSQGQTMSDIDHGASAAAVDAMDMMGADALPDTELHLQLSPGRPATADDSTRADMILVDARAALRKYVDVRVAAADGFEELPAAAGKHALHHLTNWAWAAAEGRRFDPAKPTSLLYREGADGTLQLAGAMYTAPASASIEELDRRIPVSLARWHRHVNWCTPRAATGSQWLATRDETPLYGPRSPVASRDACDAEGGAFYRQVFGWMVHVALVGSDDPGVVWRGGSVTVNADSTAPHETPVHDSASHVQARLPINPAAPITAQSVANPRHEQPVTVATVDPVVRIVRPHLVETSVSLSAARPAPPATTPPLATRPVATPPIATPPSRTVFAAPAIITGSFRSGDATVAYDRFDPAGRMGRRPAIVLLHDGMGLASQATFFHDLALTLAQRGYEVEVVHYLDRSGTVTVDAAARRAHFREWVGAVRGALTDLAHSPNVDPDKLGVFGTGLGATIALAVGATDPDVKAVVEYSGAIPARAASLVQRMPPVLIAQGDKDRAVPLMEAYRIRAMCQAVQAPVELDVFYGQGHVVEGADADNLRRKTFAFFDRYLQVAP